MLDASRTSREKEADRLAKEAADEKAVEAGEGATFKEITFADIPMHIHELPVAQVASKETSVPALAPWAMCPEMAPRGRRLATRNFPACEAQP